MSEPPENWQRFGEWMLERRQLLGLSQEKAADLAGIHRQQWYRIENGANTKRSTIISIASALSVEPDVALSIAFGLSERPTPDRSEITRLPEELAELNRIFLSLSSAQRKDILTMVRALYAATSGVKIIDDVDLKVGDARELRKGQG